MFLTSRVERSEKNRVWLSQIRFFIVPHDDYFLREKWCVLNHELSRLSSHLTLFCFAPMLREVVKYENQISRGLIEWKAEKIIFHS